MSVSREDVERIARLSALAVDDATLSELTTQIGRILDYVSQLDAVPGSPGTTEYPGPRQPLREDKPREQPVSLDLSLNAPAFSEGLFLVPRLGGVGSAGKPAADDE